MKGLTHWLARSPCAWVFVLAVSALLGLVQPARAGGIYATYVQTDPGTPFAFTNNTTSGDYTIKSGSVGVSFNFVGISGLPAEVIGGVAAHLTITGYHTTAAAVMGSGDTRQAFNSSATKISITLDSTGQNLMTAIITPKVNQGASGVPGSGDPFFRVLDGKPFGNIHSTTTFDSNPGGLQDITLTSDFVNFSTTGSRVIDQQFSNFGLWPGIGSGGFLADFVASTKGQFRGGVTVTAVPEPASLALGGLGIAGLVGFALYRRARNRAK
jgi:hypothetical protein